MKVANRINSARAARAAFLAELQPALRKQYRKGLPQNRQCCDIRTAWCYWIDAAAKDGRISNELADTAEL